MAGNRNSGRKSKIKSDVEFYALYSNKYYEDCKHCDIYEPNELDLMLKKIGLTYKTLLEYMSKKRELKNGYEIYKQTTKNKMIKLI